MRALSWKATRTAKPNAPASALQQLIGRLAQKTSPEDRRANAAGNKATRRNCGFCEAGFKFLSRGRAAPLYNGPRSDQNAPRFMKSNAPISGPPNYWDAGDREAQTGEI